MADQLKRVRSQLIASLNQRVIKQILDGLLDEDVLNEGEKDGIIQANKTTADTARDLIDTVRKKGNVASEKFFALLQSKDKSVYSSLDLNPQ